MRIFDWLKPKSIRDNTSPSVLAQIANEAGVLLLDHGQTLAQLAEAKYPEAERIAESLREFPDDWAWRFKGYELQHVPTGFTLWVANEDYGLAEVISNGVKQGFKKPEQQIIWPAVEAWLARGKVGFTGRLPKVKITGSRGTYWCVADGHPWAGAGDSPAEAYRSWARAVSIAARKDQKPNEFLHVWSGVV